MFDGGSGDRVASGVRLTRQGKDAELDSSIHASRDLSILEWQMEYETWELNPEFGTKHFNISGIGTNRRGKVNAVNIGYYQGFSLHILVIVVKDGAVKLQGVIH